MAWAGVFGGLFVAYIFPVTLEYYDYNSIALAHRSQEEAKQLRYFGQEV